MKTILTTYLCLFLFSLAFSQTEVDLLPDGIVVPRTTPGAVASPVEGQLIYRTDTDNYWYYDGSMWQEVNAIQSQLLDADGDTKVELIENAGTDQIKILLEGNDAVIFQYNGLGIVDELFTGSLTIGDGGGTNARNNTMVGITVGNSITTGGRNSFFGRTCGVFTSSGADNSFYGYNAGQMNSTGNENSFFGSNSGFNNTTGKGNSFFGFSAGENNTAADNNSFFGYRAGIDNTGASNSFLGSNAGFRNTTGNNNSFFGADSGLDNTTGFFNSFFGSQAGSNNSTGTNNSYFGVNSGFSNTTGDGNSCFGVNAGLNSVTGFKNSFFGTCAGEQNTTGDNNTYVGHESGKNSTGSNNVFIGYNSGFNETGSEKLYIANDSDDEDNALIYGEFDNRILKLNGSTAIQPDGSSEEEGLFIIGKSTVDEVVLQLDNNDTGGRLFSIISSGGTDPSGQGNFIVKDETSNVNRMVIDDSGDVGLGTDTPSSKLEISGDLTISTDGTANSEGIIIAGNAATNKVYIEMHNNDTGGVNYSLNSSGGAAGAGQGKWFVRDEDAAVNRILIDNAGQVGIGTDDPSHILHITGVGRSTQSTWDTSSDKRAKENIADLENAGNLLKQFRPVRFDWKKEYRTNETVREFGFIAQEVEEVLPQMVTAVEETIGDEIVSDFRVLNTSALTPLLVKGYQELAEENEHLKKEVAELKAMMNQIMSKMSEE